MTQRTLLIESDCNVHLDNNHLIIERGEQSEEFYVDDIDCVVFESLEVSITLHLINTLLQKDVNVIICDQKRFPYSGIFPLYGTKNAKGKIFEQVNWTCEFKDLLWQNVISQKIKSQQAILESVGKEYCFDEKVIIGDKTNAEGRFAKVYFEKLFGKNFKRQVYPENINAGLNYGYTIMLSKMSRIIAGHGYSLPMGIHHIGENNPYNLACDFIEPFRPIIDKVVWKNKDKALDREYKDKLILSLYDTMMYKGEKTTIASAMERYFLDGVNSSIDGIKLGEIII